MLPHVLTHKYVTHYTGKMYKCVTREQKRENCATPYRPDVLVWHIAC